MDVLSDPAIVSAWDAGQDLGPLERALVLLGAASGCAGRAQALALTIGELDAQLLALREQMLGPRLNGQCVCPRCGARVEFTAEVPALRSLGAADGAPGPELSLELGVLSLRFRLPTVADLLEASQATDAAAVRAALVERCVRQAVRNGSPVAAAQLSAEEVAQLAKAMGEADPQGDLLLALECGCGAAWEAPLDAGAFVWSELTAEARRLLREVDTLARVYGWTEGEILGLGARRRQRYLEMVGV